MGESRTELIQWINQLLELNYTKVEQCGTGAAYCQILDTIYHDVTMSKVKFNAKQQYDYLNNFKVLQSTFKKHSIEKPVPVDRLVNCKMQDNLEFLQWLKKYWDLNYPGGEYDAVGRRKGDAPATGAGLRPQASTSSARTSATGTGGRTSAAGSVGSGSATGARRPAAAAGGRVASGTGAGARSGGGASDAALQALTREMDDMKISVEGLEKERDFYFNKLRDIEIIIGARLESNDETMTEVEKEQLEQMQAILYSTEEGFEVPEGEEEQALEDEEETF